MGVTLCSARIYLNESNGIAYASICLICIYILVEAYCLYLTIKTSHSSGLGEDKLLLLFYITLNGTLIIRAIFLAGGIRPFCYPEYAYMFIEYFCLQLKDLCLLILLIRIWELLYALDAGNIGKIMKPLKNGTYIFMIMNYAITTAICIVHITLKNGIIMIYYSGVIQLLIFLAYSFAVFKLFSLSKNNNPNSGTGFLNSVLIYMVISILIRVLNSWIINTTIDNKLIENVIALIAYLLTDLIPCTLIAMVLFNATSKPKPVEQSDDDSILD